MWRDVAAELLSCSCCWTGCVAVSRSAALLSGETKVNNSWMGVSAAAVKHHSPHCSQLKPRGRLVGAPQRLTFEWQSFWLSLANIEAAAEHNSPLILDLRVSPALLVVWYIGCMETVASHHMSFCAQLIVQLVTMLHRLEEKNGMSPSFGFVPFVFKIQ